MSTSSIFSNIIISDPKKAEELIDAFEASSKDPAWVSTAHVKPPLADIEAIRKLMSKQQVDK